MVPLKVFGKDLEIHLGPNIKQKQFYEDFRMNMKNVIKNLFWSNEAKNNTKQDAVLILGKVSQGTLGIGGEYWEPNRRARSCRHDFAKNL